MKKGDELTGYAFISYSTKNESVAHQFAERFKNSGIECWMAPESIPGGMQYAEAITDAIRNCSCFVLLASADAQSSAPVRNEIEVAMAYGKIFIPILIENFELSDYLIYYLMRWQILRIYDIDGNTEEYDKAIQGITKHTGCTLCKSISSDGEIGEVVVENENKKKTADAYVTGALSVKDTATAVCDALEKESIRTILTDYSFTGGAELPQSSITAIRQTACMVLVAPEKVENDKKVKNELLYAAMLDKPVLLLCEKYAAGSLFEYTCDTLRVSAVYSGSVFQIDGNISVCTKHLAQRVRYISGVTVCVPCDDNASLFSTSTSEQQNSPCISAFTNTIPPRQQFDFAIPSSNQMSSYAVNNFACDGDTCLLTQSDTTTLLVDEDLTACIPVESVEIEPGTVINGQYIVLKKIGQGGMSVVFLVENKRTQDVFALKEIRRLSWDRNDTVVSQALLSEINIMKQLDHPAIPRIIDVFKDEQSFFILMDYVEGVSLDELIMKHGALHERFVTDVALQLCDILAYLHELRPPIIYRDMKPRNVILAADGRIKLIDFGIAKICNEADHRDTCILGTAGFASPEQYKGFTNARSDIYALGMTLFCLLTGKLPTEQAYKPIRLLRPEISKNLEHVIDKCLRPDPLERYGSCNEIADELTNDGAVFKKNIQD